MKSQTYIKNLKITPKKLRMITDAVRKLEPDVALDHLSYTPRKSARMLYKVVQSAVSNAKTILKTESKNFRFHTLLVEEGNKLKRFRPGSRGMAKRYVKQLSHVKVVLETKERSAQ